MTISSRHTPAGRRARWLAATLTITLAATACDSPRPSPSATPGASPAASAAAVVASVVVTPGAVLLTAAGETAQLKAAASAADGSSLQGTVTWTSSDPGVASVDATGLVTAAAIGMTMVTATVGGVASPPVYVTMAKPVGGAVLITDEQIVDGPSAIDPAAEPSADNAYEVTLTGVAGVEPGAIVINRGEKTVAGRVVSTTPVGGDARVQLVVVPPGELFDAVEFRDTVDLSQGPFEVPQHLAETYDVVQDGSSFTFTPKAGTASAGTATLASFSGVPQGTRRVGPFDNCEVEAGFGSDLPIPFSLSQTPTFSFTADGTASRELTAAGTKYVVQATPTFEFETALEIETAFEVKIECKVTLAKRTFRVPGWAGLFFGGDVEFGAGFEVAGKVTLASAKLGAKVEVAPTLSATLDCPAGGSCSLDGDATAEADVEPVVETPNLNQLAFEPSLGLFGWVELDAGNADIEGLQFEAIEAKAGLELSADLTLEGLQIDDTDEDGRSSYALAAKGEVGPGIKVAEFLEYVGLEAVDLLKIEFEAPLGDSPKGTAKADKPRYLPGDAATVTVTLEDTVFPRLGAYNVDRVVVVKRDGLSTTELGSVTATEGQTEFEVQFTSPNLLDATDLYAFVVTKLFPVDFVKLEVAPASWTCEVEEPMTIQSIDDDPDKIYVMFDGGSECRLVAEVGDNGFQGDASDMIVSIDTDPDETGWDGEPTDSDSDGRNWNPISGFAANIGSGRHTFRSRHVETNAVFEVKVTVQVDLIGSGPNTRMTVSNVVIRLVP